MHRCRLNNTPVKMHIRECCGVRPPPGEIKNVTWLNGLALH